MGECREETLSERSVKRGYLSAGWPGFGDGATLYRPFSLGRRWPGTSPVISDLASPMARQRDTGSPLPFADSVSIGPIDLYGGSDLTVFPTLYRKVCLLGDIAVGKTSLVRRFVDGVFDPSYRSSIGLKVSRRSIGIPGAFGMRELLFLLWDLAGDGGLESYLSHLHGTAGVVLVYDLTRPETLAALRDLSEVLFCASSDVKLVVAANKLDLVEDQQMDLSHVETMAASLNASCYLTSARTGVGVDALFLHLAKLLVDTA